VVEEAVLLVSELATNAVLHTASGNSGVFEITVCQGPGHARIEVCDQGAEDAPTTQPTEPLTEAGRGLSLVELVAARWGHTGDSTGRSVFFELSWDPDQ
jgi:serine/threonine-protein kinase RsbW